MLDLRFVRADRLTVTTEITIDGSVRWHVSANLRAGHPRPYLVHRNALGEFVKSPVTLTHTTR